MKKLYLLPLVALLLQACNDGGDDGAPANRAPTASNQATLTQPGSAVSGTLEATDADGDTLTFAIATDPASGAVTLSGTGNSDYEYVPNAGFSGEDTFTFTANDGSADSTPATVTVTVNAAPTVTGTSVTTSGIVAVSGAVTASDAEGDTLSFAVDSPPAKGTLTTFNAATGGFTYTPDPAQDGADSFSVTAADSFQVSAPATVAVEIFRWAGTQQIGSAGEELAPAGGLLLRADGSIVMSGSTTGAFASQTNAGGRDAFYRGVDRRGAEEWLVQYGEATDEGGRNLLDDPQSDGFFAVTNGDAATVHKFNDDGTTQWEIKVDFGAFTVFAPAYWSNIDAAGSLYLLSWYDHGSGLGTLITKLSGTNGDVIWQRQLIPSADDPDQAFIVSTRSIQARGIDFDAAGNAVVTGDFTDAGGTARPCTLCSFVASFDAQGDDRWMREFETISPSCNSPTDDRMFRVTVAPDDTLYVVGSGNYINQPDTRVVRLNADATQELWAYCDDTGDSVTYNFEPVHLTQDGGVLVYSTILAPHNVGLEQPLFGEAMVTKLDDLGTARWRRSLTAFRPTGSIAIVEAGALVVDDQGLIYVTGHTDGQMAGSVSAGNKDFFLRRLGSDGTLQ